MDIDDLLEEAMIFEAMTGKMSMIKMTRTFLKELHKQEVGFIRTEKYIAGIPYVIDNSIQNGYLICEINS